MTSQCDLTNCYVMAWEWS